MKGGITPEGLKKEVQKITSTPSNNLKKLLRSIEVIRKRKSSKINFSDPIISRQGKAVFYPNTINLIQGQAGVHKSRLAEIIAASLIKRKECDSELLLFEKTAEEDFGVLYIDTERNLRDQFPAAIQNLQKLAGHGKYEDISQLKFASLLEFPRKDRFSTLQAYLEKLQAVTSIPLFIILDVSTDCVEDFNKTDKSMELIDLMNVAINDFNITFLCLIHENPRSEKARGHFGTELMNKSSTALQVGFEKDSNNRDTDLIRIRFLKCRSSYKYEPFYACFSEQEKTLLIADEEYVKTIADNSRDKASLDSTKQELEQILGDGISKSRQDLLNILCYKLNVSIRTVEQRLKTIIERGISLLNKEGDPCALSKLKKDNKTMYYLDKKTQ